MPCIHSPYRAPWFGRAGDIQTVLPTLFRKVPPLPFRRSVLETEDGDELLLDACFASGPRNTHETVSEQGGGAAYPRPLAIVAHGMEGSSESWYVRGMAQALFNRGWDILAWNMRGCGGRPNRKVSFYHSGKTDDLRAVIRHAQQSHARYALVGFSLGGNVVLKHMGELGGESAPGFIAAAAISVPVDLSGCASRLALWRNYVYQKRFLVYFHAKIRAKMRVLPGQIDDAGFAALRTLKDFDNRYTAPDFGYADAEAYWEANSSLRFLKSIEKPTLLLTSLDDPFLSESCFPVEVAELHPWLTLELSRKGGHCGFMAHGLQGPYYGEMRVAEYLEKYLPSR
jgi:uncharacterized protein